jgi:hypothetical protein
MHPHKRLGTYRVGAAEFHTRADALMYASILGGEPRWDFNEDVFGTVDWATPVETPLLELYRQRAQQLRDTYDFVSLFFSGGVDSAMALHAFIDNNIHLDEIVMYRPARMVPKANKTDLSSGNIFSEIEFAAVPHLQEHLRDSKTVVRFLDLDVNVEKFLTHEDTMAQYTSLKNPNPNYLARLAMCTQDPVWNALYLADKKVCHIQGVDKPVVSFRNGEYYFQFNDNMLMNVFSPAFGSANADMVVKNQFHELFYWTPDLPQIVIKQAQTVKNLAQNNVLLRLLISGTYNVNESTMTPVLKYLYPPHVVAVRDRFTVGKISPSAKAPHNKWFYDMMPTNTQGAFADMFKALEGKVSGQYLHPTTHDLTVFRSPFYKI